MRKLISFLTIVACGFAIITYLEGITYWDMVSVILQTPAYNACLISVLYMYIITPAVGLVPFDTQIAFRYHNRCTWMTVRLTTIIIETIMFMCSFLLALTIPAIVYHQIPLRDCPWLLCGLAFIRLCLLGFIYQLLCFSTNNRLFNAGIIIVYLFVVECNPQWFGILSSIVPQYILSQASASISLPQTMIIPLQALCALYVCYSIYDRKNLL